MPENKVAGPNGSSRGQAPARRDQADAQTTADARRRDDHEAQASPGADSEHLAAALAADLEVDLEVDLLEADWGL